MQKSSLILIVAICLLLILPSVSAKEYTREEYLTWVDREVSAGWACTYYDSKYADSANVISLANADKVMKWYNKKHVTGDGYWEALFNYTVDVPIFKLCAGINLFW